MKKLFLILVVLFINTVNAGSNHNIKVISLTLEQIFFITLLVMFILLFVLIKIAKIKDKNLLKIMTIIALVLLSIDYLYLKYFHFKVV